MQRLLDRVEGDAAATIREVQGARLERIHMAHSPTALRAETIKPRLCACGSTNGRRLWGGAISVTQLVRQRTVSPQTRTHYLRPL